MMWKNEAEMSEMSAVVARMTPELAREAAAHGTAPEVRAAGLLALHRHEPLKTFNQIQRDAGMPLGHGFQIFKRTGVLYS